MSPGTARMGKMRENNANKVKVSLYIINRRFERRKLSGGLYKRMKSSMQVGRDAKFRWRKRTETEDFVDVGPKHIWW
jgi:hypothetical protein